MKRLCDISSFFECVGKGRLLVDVVNPIGTGITNVNLFSPFVTTNLTSENLRLEYCTTDPNPPVPSAPGSWIIVQEGQKVVLTVNDVYICRS